LDACCFFGNQLDAAYAYGNEKEVGEGIKASGVPTGYCAQTVVEHSVEV